MQLLNEQMKGQVVQMNKAKKYPKTHSIIHILHEITMTHNKQDIN